MLHLISDNLEQFTLDINRADHQFLIDGYITSHTVRNHSPKTIKREKSFLNSWFKSHPIFFTWTAMKPIYGREKIIQYTKDLIKTGVSNHTLRANLNILSRFFSYVLQHPYLKREEEFVRIEALYGPLEQPISEYDIPKHSYDGEQRGTPMDPCELLNFYQCLRKNYIIDDGSIKSAIRARYYAMAVLAGLCGFRIDEILHLDLNKDLFFKSFKIQTRFAKGTKGSGKRARVTLFPPFARDTLKYYISHFRPLLFTKKNDLLFPNTQGEILSYRSACTSLNQMISVANKNHFTVLKHLSWHWFRRLFATRFIEKFPHQLSVLIHLLGHSSANTVHKYIQHSEAWMDEKILKALQGDY